MKLHLQATCLASAALIALPVLADFSPPDSIVLKDGTEVPGLIIQNTADAVLLQEEFAENWYPKTEIVRILDEADDNIVFTDALRKGTLPSWRIIVNDLRGHDIIRSLVEIPSTTIDVGIFQNVPYKSFRVNQDVEINIFGDPKSPAGVEVGVYGPRKSNARLQKTLRSFLAGYMTSRDEIDALYNLDFEGGKTQAGNLTFEVTPPTAEDAYGAWWISVFNEDELNAIRLSDSDYDALTVPMSEVVDDKGMVTMISDLLRLDRIIRLDPTRPTRMGDDLDGTPVIARGFYRDESGNFRLLAGGDEPLLR